ncbi:mechanosensitive ion channel family protein [Thalassotalea aquiviva]|uniref:mechanosensitive ion channel family protein n=1 Tax=Thalassotalea aquiviva TaxID=3242415 RepID=UPI00352A863E
MSESAPIPNGDGFTPTSLIQDEINYLNSFYDIIITFFANYSIQLVGAFLIFIIGFIVAGKVSKVVLNLCERKNIDITLSRFLANTAKMILVALILIIALGKLGISLTPFVAAIGAISLGAGLAIQGLLSNYAAGFNIILLRPFVVGDTIKVQGVTGIVEEVLLAYTILVDEDGVYITIPNKHIVGEVLHNSHHDSLLELSVGISYKHDPLAVIDFLKPVIESQDFVSEQKKPLFGIDEFGDSAIIISIRLWTPTVSLYATKYHAHKLIYQSLKRENIAIPYPQRDVHIISSSPYSDVNAKKC